MKPVKHVRRARTAGTWLLVGLAVATGAAASLMPVVNHANVAYADCTGVGPPIDTDGLCQPTATPTLTPTPTSTPIDH